MSIVLTEVAELRLRAFLQASSKTDKPATGIRVAVVDGGCSGYSYALDLATAPREADLRQEGKVPVFIDKDSAPLLQGLVIDYVEGLTQSGFKFSNPNATDTCGCGQSFQAGDCSPAGVPCS